MVVNIDHTCPLCRGDEFPCGVCGDTGTVRQPADWVGAQTGRISGAKTLHGADFVGDVPTLDPALAKKSLSDFREGRWKYAEDVVKDLRSGVTEDELDDALDKRQNSKDADQLWLPMILPPKQSVIRQMLDGFVQFSKQVGVPDKSEVEMYKRFYKAGFVKGLQAGRESK